MSIRDSALIAVKSAMGLTEKESALIICDRKSRKIGYTLFETAKYAKEAILLEITERESHGAEPPEAVAAAMLKSDVVIIPTTKSMSHTRARKEASEKGARIATLPGITEEIMERTLDVNYREMSEITCKLAKLLTSAKDVNITSEIGTDLTLSIESRNGHPDTGICHNPGDFTNLPAGEAYIAPVEGSSSGKLVIDGSLAGYGLIKEPLIIEIKDGYADKLSGDGSEFLLEIFNKYGEKARNVAELGIGTNPEAIIGGNVLEDEKVLKTVHIAFGDNSTFGGNVSVDSHLDCVFKNPNLTIDNSKIMEKGDLINF